MATKTKRLTDTTIRQVKPAEKDYQRHVGEVPGLFLRVRPNGTKDWLFRYMHGGVRHKLSLGKYPAISLEKARALARQKRDMLNNGIEPHAERKRVAVAKLAAQAIQDALPQTVAELFDLWKTKALTLTKDGGRKDNGDETKRKFEKDVFPRIGALPLDTVRRAHVLAILDNVKARGAPRIAGMIFSDLRQMFAFAVEREIIATDPTAGLNKRKLGGNAGERDRVLSDAEVKQLAKALPAALNEVAQHAVWIMLSTCCRIGEIASARWSDVSLNDGVWVIPADASKNGKPLQVSLSGFALSHFQALKDARERTAERTEKAPSQWVMPARHHEGSVCPKSLAKQVADRQRGDKEAMKGRSALTGALMLPGGKWTPHDLRRSGATMMAALGVRPDVIENCLNHTEQNKLKRIYQRHNYAPEMQAAWALLGERLEALLSEKDTAQVVPLNRRKVIDIN